MLCTLSFHWAQLSQRFLNETLPSYTCVFQLCFVLKKESYFALMIVIVGYPIIDFYLLG